MELELYFKSTLRMAWWEESKMKTALITGASSGIGQAAAIELSQKGYSLILIARRRDRLEQLKSKILNSTDNQNIIVECYTLDLKEQTSIKNWFQENIKNLEKVDILINCAGLARGISKVQDSNLLDWNEMIETNINGLITMTRLLIPNMIKKNKGHIVNLGSIAGRWSYTGGSVYCGTKHFVKAFSEALRQDLIGYNIRVTNIEPGMVNTEFSNVRLRDDKKAEEVYKGFSPLTAKDIAEIIVWSLERPQHVNIQEMVVFPTAQVSATQVYRELP